MKIEMEPRIVAAAHKLCAMRQVNPDARVSETVRITHLELARRECWAAAQVHVALTNAGVFESS